jgi:hypothetical protein
MVRRASIAACLVALFATIAATPAHTAEPVAEPTPAVVNGAHEAVAWIRVNRSAGSEEGRYETFERTRQRYVQWFESPIILVAVLRQPEIANLETMRNEEPDPTAWLLAALDVTAPEGTELIRVGVRGERMDDLQQIVDAVAQTFVTDMVEREKTNLLARREQLVKKYSEVQTELRAKEEALTAKSGGSDAFSPEIRRELLLGEIGSLRAQRTPLQIELHSIQADIAVAGTLGEQADQRKVARLCILEKQIAQLTADMDTTLRGWSIAQADRKAEEVSIDQHRRVFDEIGRQLESTSLDLTGPPKIQRVEVPKSTEKP